MRRVLLALLGVLLSTTLLTVLVGWSCVWFRPAPGGPAMMPSFWHDQDGSAWMASGQRGLGWTAMTVYGMTGLTEAGRQLTQRLPAWIDPPQDGPLDERAVVVVACGWPARCLHARLLGHGHLDPGPGGVWHTGLGPQRVDWMQWDGAIVLHDDRTPRPSRRVLPWRIHWPGLAVDLLVWSVPGALVLAALGVRRIVRHRHRRCPSCGYPQGDSTQCSECGRTFSAAAVR